MQVVAPTALQQGLTLATALKREAFTSIIKETLDKLPAEPTPPVFAVDPARLPRYLGNYRDAASGLAMAVTLQNGRLMGQVQGGPLVALVPSAENVLRVVEVNATLTFNERGGLVESMTLVQGAQKFAMARVTDAASGTPAASAPAATVPNIPAPPAIAVRRATGPRNWASFRGESGNGDGRARGDRMGRDQQQWHRHRINPETGVRAFRGRVGTGGAFRRHRLAPMAISNIASEDGEVYVLSATSALTQLAKNEMKEVIMATPAISDGLVILRTLGHVYGIGQ